MSLNKRVGFIGAGQMAEALARGFVARGVITVSAITATDPVAARKEVFKSFGANVTGSNAEVRYSGCLRAMEMKEKEQERAKEREKNGKAFEPSRRRRCWPAFFSQPRPQPFLLFSSVQTSS